MKTKSLLVLSLIAVTTVVAAGCMHETTPADDMMVDTGAAMVETMPTTDTGAMVDTTMPTDDAATVDAMVNEVDTTASGTTTNAQ